MQLQIQVENTFFYFYQDGIGHLPTIMWIKVHYDKNKTFTVYKF